jgi:hypothetical protein
MISEKRAKRSVVLFMLAWCGVLLIGFVYLVNLEPPVVDQIKQLVDAEDQRPLMTQNASPTLQNDELGAREIKKKWALSKPVHDQLLVEYQKLPKFQPPANVHLTEKQVLALNDIYMTGWKAIRDFQIHDLGRDPKFFKVVASYAYIPVLYEISKMQGLVKHQMTEEEMNWVLRREMEAALFACNVKWDTHQGTPEEIERLRKTRNAISSLVDLSKEVKPEEGGRLYFPERLDTSKVPRANVALVLKLHDQIRWTEVRFFMIPFDEAQIMQAAKALPE